MSSQHAPRSVRHTWYNPTPHSYICPCSRGLAILNWAEIGWAIACIWPVWSAPCALNKPSQLGPPVNMALTSILPLAITPENLKPGGFLFNGSGTKHWLGRCMCDNCHCGISCNVIPSGGYAIISHVWTWAGFFGQFALSSPGWVSDISTTIICGYMYAKWKGLCTQNLNIHKGYPKADLHTGISGIGWNFQMEISTCTIHTCAWLELYQCIILKVATEN